MATSFIAIPTTETEAVNALLRAVGIAPVGSLSSTNLDVVDAIQTLSTVNRSVQGKGWYFNTRFNREYLRDTMGEIELPANVLEVKMGANSAGATGSIIVRDGKLYDLDNDTSVLTTNYYLDIIELLEFEQLPQAARDYIVARAIRIHTANDDDADADKRNQQSQDEVSTYSTLFDNEQEMTNRSFFDKLDNAHSNLRNR